MIMNLFAVISALLTLWIILAAASRLVEGQWNWGWPVELFHDLIGRR